MPIRDREGIVLRQYALADSDRIVVVLTRDVGMLRGVAQGVRKPKSRIGGCLEPLNHVRLQVYSREGADLCRIRHCELVHSYLGKTPGLEHVYAYEYMAELMQELVPESSPNPLFFRLLLAALDAGEKRGAGEALIRYFEIWCLRLSGLLPSYDACSSCGSSIRDSQFYAWIETGEGRCAACARGTGVRLGAPASALLRSAAEISPVQFISSSGSLVALREIEGLTQRMLETHLEKRLKSRLLLQELLRDSYT
jgi:DNA repair protein RecO (recombination protein O)